jgi:hypothetical protein
LDAARSQVSKLKFAFTGPWQVTANFPGSSYAIEHCYHPNQKDKKHTLSPTPYPNNLIPFQPVGGPNTHFSQLYHLIGEHPFKEAGIKGFASHAPFHVTAWFIEDGNFKDFRWLSLSELNGKVNPFPLSSNDKWVCYFAKEPPLITPLMYNGPPPSPPIAPPRLATMHHPSQT